MSASRSFGITAMLQPHVTVRGKRYHSFQLCGMTGLALASLLALALVHREGLSYLVITGIWFTCCIWFLAFAMATKIATGEERLTYYHHEITLIAVVAVVLKLWHQPALPYLDIVILGIGLFLACGRIGCLMVGCCHGRPSRWGIRYGQEHARSGFAGHLVGVRLFPLQAAESIAALGIVAVGATLLFRSHAPGAAFAWYTITYGAARFGLEFLRGDPDRPYWRSYSESQWISLSLTGVVVCSEFSGGLPFSAWHVGVFLSLALTMGVITLLRRAGRGSGFQILHPRHVEEIAQAMRTELSPSHITGLPRVRSTSLGIQISGSTIETTEACLIHYAFSAPMQRMTRKTAAILANLLGQLIPELGPPSLVEGRKGVFHVLFPLPAMRALASK